MQYAYAPGGQLDTIGSAHDVSHRLAVLDIISLSQADFIAAVPVLPDVHEVEYVGTPLQFQEEASQTHNGEVGGKWQVQVNYSDIALDVAKAEIKNRVRGIANAGADNQVSPGERQRLIIKALRILEEGVLGLAETNTGTIGWGLDHNSWPAPAQAWDAKRLEVRADLVDAKKVEDTRDVEIVKLAEIDALADMTAARAYDVTAGWPPGTIF